jgi:hypothetical protein
LSPLIFIFFSFHTDTIFLNIFFLTQGRRYSSSAFLLWKQETITNKPDEELEAIKARLHDQQRKLLHRFIRSLQQGRLGKSFDRWQMYVETNKDSRTLLEKVKDEREERRANLIKRTISRIRHGRLFRAFRSWFVGAQDQRCHRQNLNRAIGRWKFRKASLAFEEWNSFVNQRLHARELMLKVLKRCDNVASLKAMSTWRGHLINMQQLKIDKERLMLRMSNNLASADELHEIIRMVMHEAKSLLDADQVSLYIYNEKKQVSHNLYCITSGTVFIVFSIHHP